LNGVWRSWLARAVWDREVEGSSPFTPTKRYLCVTIICNACGYFISSSCIGRTTYRRVFVAKKIIHGELKRKLVHIAVTSFVAFWPWIMGWKAIQLIGIAMILVLLVNRQVKVLHYLGGIRQQTYGDVFLALSITTTALN
jgi:hypothetical protein